MLCLFRTDRQIRLFAAYHIPFSFNIGLTSNKFLSKPKLPSSCPNAKPSSCVKYKIGICVFPEPSVSLCWLFSRLYWHSGQLVTMISAPLFFAELNTLPESFVTISSFPIARCAPQHSILLGNGAGSQPSALNKVSKIGGASASTMPISSKGLNSMQP